MKLPEDPFERIATICLCAVTVFLVVAIVMMSISTIAAIGG